MSRYKALTGLLSRVLASVRGVGEVLAVVIADRGGPGEREEGLDFARRHLRRVGVEADQIVRIDVPSSRGAGASPPGGPDQHGTFRAELIWDCAVVTVFQSFWSKAGIAAGGRQLSAGRRGPGFG